VACICGVVWISFSLLMMWAYPAFIAPLFNKFTALEDAALATRIQGLLTKCGFKSQGIFVWTARGARARQCLFQPAWATTNASCSSIR